MRTDPPTDPANQQLPSQTVRTAVTLLLFVHLFAVAAAMVSSPQDNMTSRLFSRLGGIQFLGGYARALWMASAYDFYYTYYNPGVPEFLAARSTEHRIEADLIYADGRTETMRIPEQGLFPRLRAQRQRNLCSQTAQYVGQQGAESYIPAAIAKHLLLTTNAQSVNIRLIRWTPQTMDMVSSTDARARDPHDARYRQVVYTGIAQMRHGEVSYQKLETPEQSSPSGASPGPATSAPPPSTAAPPPSTAAPPPRRPASGPAPR